MSCWSLIIHASCLDSLGITPISLLLPPLEEGGGRPPVVGIWEILPLWHLLFMRILHSYCALYSFCVKPVTFSPPWLLVISVTAPPAIKGQNRGWGRTAKFVPAFLLRIRISWRDTLHHVCISLHYFLLHFFASSPCIESLQETWSPCTYWEIGSCLYVHR